MDFARWLTDWLKRHPLKEPDGLDPASYTAQVMAKVADDVAAPVGASVRPTRWWRLAPRPALVFATAAAAMVVAVGILRHPRQPLVDTPSRELRFAESSPSPTYDQWIEETMRLLDEVEEFEEEFDEEFLGNPSEEDEWLNEMQMFDEADLTGRS